MEKDKKYNIILGLMIFFFILVVGISLAWGLSSINKDSNKNEVEKQNSNTADENESVDVKKEENNASSENKNESQNQVEQITNLERVSIEEYIGKIYLYGTIGAMPNFTDINKTDEEWIWYVAFWQCKNKDVAYKYEINSNAKELFGSNLKKEVGNEILGAYWDSEGEYFSVKPMGLMVADEPHYVVYSIEKNQNKYTVEIVEYTVNMEEVWSITDTKTPSIKIKHNDKEIKRFPEGTENNEIQKYVKENASNFSSRILEIEENQGKLHIVACKNK